MRGGVLMTPRILSAVEDELVVVVISEGKCTRLPVGLINVLLPCVCGSISIDERNDELSSSGFVLVTVKNVSSRLFCSARGVPFKSSTFTIAKQSIFLRSVLIRTFWKLGYEASPINSV